MKIKSFPYTWHDWKNCESHVDINLYRGHAEMANKFIVLATEPEHNPGVSVTNGCEEIAYQICKRIGIAQKDLVFVERYEHSPDEYDQVEFDADFSNPRWKRISEDEFLRWTGEKVLEVAA